MARRRDDDYGARESEDDALMALFGGEMPMVEPPMGDEPFAEPDPFVGPTPFPIENPLVPGPMPPPPWEHGRDGMTRAVDEGSMERGRDLRPPSQTPTTFAPPEQAPAPSFDPALPRGVTTEDAATSPGFPSPFGEEVTAPGVPSGSPFGEITAPGFPTSAPFGGDGRNAFSTPDQGMSSRPQDDNVSTPPAMNGPRRRSSQPSVLYSQAPSPTLTGRAGGLLEGGLGSTGTSDRTGKLQPTALFQRLLQMLGGA